MPETASFYFAVRSARRSANTKTETLSVSNNVDKTGQTVYIIICDVFVLRCNQNTTAGNIRGVITIADKAGLIQKGWFHK